MACNICIESKRCGCSHSCDCGANTCSPKEIERVPAIPCTRRIKLPCDAPGVSFPLTECGNTCDADIKKLSGWVRRLGQTPWLVKYPAWDFDDRKRVMFRFDPHLWKQPPGRYEFQLRRDDCVPLCRAELVLKRECPLDLSNGALIKAAPARHFPLKPSGVLPVFDAISTFTAELCRVWERGSSVLPLSPADATTLCAVVICKPVELVVSDGVNSEVVLYTGCVAGVPQIARSGPQFKFPKGSSIAFQWTPANVAASLTPCP